MMPISREEFNRLPREEEIFPTMYTDIEIQKTQYMLWRRGCTAAYEYMFVKKIQPTVIGIETDTGRDMHAWMKEFFGRVDYTKLEKLRSFRSAYELFKPMLPTHPILYSYADNFIKFEAAEWERLSNLESPLTYWAPVERELEIRIPKVGFFHHIDRIDRLPTGGLIIIDYKPKIHPTSNREELLFYTIGMMASEKFAEPFTHIGCFGYVTGEAKSWEVKPQALRTVSRHVNEFRTFLHDVRQGKATFTKTESMACQWCWFNDICKPADEAKLIGGDEDASTLE